MKLRAIIITSIIWFLPAAIFSQAITTDPVFPSEDNSVTITFDATEASRSDLVGFTGELYAHTGVIVSESDKNSGSWSYVVSEWGENLSKLRLTNVGSNLWELEIDDIREFYEIPPSVDRIYQLAFVFRSADTNLQSEDLFVDIFEAGITVRFNQPFTTTLNPYFTGINETVDFVIEGTTPAGTLTYITLFDSDTEIASVNNSNTLEFSYEITSTGRTDFYVVAEDDEGGVAEDSLYVIVNPEVNRQPRPDGIEDGITYHEDGSSVTFSIFAPDKEFVYLIGDFSGWEVREEYFMNLEEINSQNAHFWLTLEDLNPGDIYRFQYFVDGEIRVADLFSELVLDPNLDQFISSSVYPDRPDYPQGLTEHPVTVIEPGRTPYEWEVPDFERPSKEELVIYELLLRDFLDESSFDVLADTLGYLERLGVNAIELMPVSEFDGNLSWGYNPSFHGALDKSYGTRQAFKQFVDEAHKRGIAVILDVVYNHAHDKSPLIRTFGSNRSGVFQTGNPLLGPGHAYNVFFHLNHDHAYIRYWLDRMNRYWVETYNIDGYRFDLTKGFASNVNNQSLLDGRNEQRIENLKRMADELWAFDEDVYIILEHFAANSEESELANYGMLLWGNHNRNYNQASMGYTQNSNFRGVHFSNRQGWLNPHLIGYMESHDEQWLMYRNLAYGNDENPDHNVTELDIALNRQKLTAAFFLTIPGPKMLWQFGELGYGSGPGECLKPGDGSSGECSPSDPGRTAEKPVRWEYFEDEERNRVYRSWSELLRLRHSNPVFSSADTEFESSLTGNVKWVKLRHNEMDVVIIGNFGVNFEESTIDFTVQGEWYDFVTGTVLNVDEVSQNFDLAPGELKLYTSEFTEPAESEVFYRVGESGFVTIPDEFLIKPNYPNPFNPGTNLTYNVPEQAPVRLDVFDILGRRVATLVNEESHSRGSFTIRFDGSELSSGVYIVRLVSGSTSRVEKMTLIK
jgi:glycosidase